MVFLRAFPWTNQKIRYPGCLAQANNNDKLLSDHKFFFVQTMRLFNMHPGGDHGGWEVVWGSFVFDFGVPAIFPHDFFNMFPKFPICSHIFLGGPKGKSISVSISIRLLC